ncbi:hypothetical protein Tco_0010337 [Tanacetum coccineum]
MVLCTKISYTLLDFLAFDLLLIIGKQSHLLDLFGHHMDCQRGIPCDVTLFYFCKGFRVRKFKEFNYLLKIDPDVLTNDIVGFKTYDEYKDGWIYEWNKNVPWLHENPWTENGKEDGYCNEGNLPGAYIVGNTLRYQDVEWYDGLKDSKLKEEALRNKAIMKGLINEDVESNDEGWKSWDDFENTNGDRNEWGYENEHEDDERYDLSGNETHELPIYNIRRFKIIKYSFRQGEEYVAIKENEYEDLTSTSEDACRAYQEIFRMMDEGWMVTRME